MDVGHQLVPDAYVKRWRMLVTKMANDEPTRFKAAHAILLITFLITAFFLDYSSMANSKLIITVET